MRIWAAAGGILFLLTMGCERLDAAAGQEQIYQVAADDAEMNAAKRDAIQSLPQFFTRLARPAADETEFMVKFDIAPGEEVEYVWAGELDRSSATMTGTLLNQPELTDHRIGQRVPIPEAEIVDWSYRRDRVTQGGYTNRVLLQRMPPEQAAELRAYFGW